MQASREDFDHRVHTITYCMLIDEGGSRFRSVIREYTSLSCYAASCYVRLTQTRCRPTARGALPALSGTAATEYG